MIKLVNFRDLGGMKTSDGRRVKPKRLLRSGEIVGIGKVDTDTLVNEYHLKLIVDFRGSRECQERPDDVIPGVRYCNLDIMRDMKQSASMHSMVEHSSDFSADDGMKKVYQAIVSDPYAQSGYHQFVRLLLEQKEGASIFHCFAGKDRTGIGAAIVLTMLGAAKDDIFEEYLKTNVQREAANQQMLEAWRKQGYTEKQLETLLQLMCVKAEYLEETYKTIHEVFGTFDAYIEKGLRIEPHEVEALKGLYLE